MTKEERATFAGLPDTLTVYRGFRGEGGEYARSWTLSRLQAEWFAQRERFERDGGPMVATLTINKADALAYFDPESEIVIDPLSIDMEAVELERLVHDLPLAA